MVHRPLRDRAGGDFLHLAVEHVYGGLGGDDEVADDHGDGNENPPVGELCDHLAQVVAGGHEADVYAGQEEHQPHEGIEEADTHAHEVRGPQAHRQQLEREEEEHDGHQGGEYLVQIGGQGGGEELHQSAGIRHVWAR